MGGEAEVVVRAKQQHAAAVELDRAALLAGHGAKPPFQARFPDAAEIAGQRCIQGQARRIRPAAGVQRDLGFR